MAHLDDYHFLTRWRVEGTCGEVADILRDPVDLTRWWPSVYLAVDEIAPPDAQGLHQRVRLLTKGWLPYTLRWDLEVIETRYPHGSTIRASGDFAGIGVWTFVQDGAFVDVTYDWRIRAEKRLLHVLAPLMRRLFEANHRWAMSQGEASLKIELLRRRASTAADRRSIPTPPGPVTYAAAGLLVGAAAIGGALGYLMLRHRRRRRARR
jgi:hypothetical protein